jgi:PhnB protein
MQVETYLFFNGRCEEALNFYHDTVGAEVAFLMRFKESPDPEACPPGAEEKIMHSTVTIGGTSVMASDGRCQGEPDFKGFSLSIAVDDEGEAKHLFDELSDGGTVDMPLAKTFWSPCFGMLTDRFGVSWMVNVAE